MSPVAPRIVHDFSYVTRINVETPFSWQAQYLVNWSVGPVAPRFVDDVSCVARR